MLSTATLECPVCLLPGCRGHEAHSATRPVCACERPMPMLAPSFDEEGDFGTCLKCGRPTQEQIKRG